MRRQIRDEIAKAPTVTITALIGRLEEVFGRDRSHKLRCLSAKPAILASMTPEFWGFLVVT